MVSIFINQRGDRDLDVSPITDLPGISLIAELVNKPSGWVRAPMEDSFGIVWRIRYFDGEQAFPKTRKSQFGANLVHLIEFAVCCRPSNCIDHVVYEPNDNVVSADDEAVADHGTDEVL